MADLIIPISCGQAVLKWSLAGKANPVTSTLGFHWLGTGDPVGIVNEIRAGAIATGGISDATKMFPVWTFLGVEAQYNDAGVMRGYSSSGAAVTGTMGAGEGMIVSSTLLVQKRTARSGRHFRGRMYLPIMHMLESQIDMMGNIGTSPYGVESAIVKVTTDFWLASTNWEPTLLHADSVITPGFTPITSFALRAKVATQRRRLNS